MTLPPDPIQQEPTYESALAAFEALSRRSGSCSKMAPAARSPASPIRASSASSTPSRCPAPKPARGSSPANGALADQAPAKRSTSSFDADPRSTQPTNFTGDTGAGGLWTAPPDYHWTQHPDGTAASYVTGPLAGDTTVLGAGKVRLWVRSEKPNVDLQATISEVRPDGKETFVQGGWVRANERKLDREKSTPLEPVLSLRESELRPMPRGRFVSGDDPALLPGAPLPGRLPDPGDDLGRQR